LNTKVVGFGCGPWRWYKGVGGIHINKGRVGEERKGKETDRCPLTHEATIGIEDEIIFATSCLEQCCRDQ
jgi:hypothetical protein